MGHEAYSTIRACKQQKRMMGINDMFDVIHYFPVSDTTMSERTLLYTRQYVHVPLRNVWIK